MTCRLQAGAGPGGARGRGGRPLCEGSPKFSLKGRTFEPYSAEEAELPTYAAVYLMTKGLARLAE